MSNNEILLHGTRGQPLHASDFPRPIRLESSSFAEYLATARLDDDVIEWGRFNPARASWLADRSGWLPLDRLLFFGDRRRMDGPEVAKYYAQSWDPRPPLFVPDRRRRLSAYLGAVVRGAAPREAFAEAFDTTPSAMQRELSSYGRDGMTFSRATRASARHPVAVAVSVMPPSADDLLLARAAMSRADHGRAPGFLARVRRAAARHDAALRAASPRHGRSLLWRRRRGRSGARRAAARIARRCGAALPEGHPPFARRLLSTSSTAPPITGARSPFSSAPTARMRAIIRPSTAMPKASRSSRASSARIPATS